ALAKSVPLEDGPAVANAAVREKLAEWYVRRKGVRGTRFRVMTALSRGGTPGPENSVGKLVSAAMAHDISAFAMDVVDMGGCVPAASLISRTDRVAASYTSIGGGVAADRRRTLARLCRRAR